MIEVETIKLQQKITKDISTCIIGAWDEKKSAVLFNSRVRFNHFPKLFKLHSAYHMLDIWVFLHLNKK